MIREGPAEEVGVTLTGQFLGEANAPSTVDKGKAIHIGHSQNSSATPTDLEIHWLFEDSAIEDTADMALKRRNIAASLQAGVAGASQGVESGSPPAGGQKRQKREGIRYGFRKDLSPSSPTADKAVEESQPKEVAVRNRVRTAPRGSRNLLFGNHF